MQQLLLIFRHCVQNSILCFLTMYVIETWEKFFHIPKWIADHHFFFYSIFLRANCEYHETKKRFFLKLIWTPEFCCTKKWACVQLLMAEQSDEILHVNITNFSRKLLNFCIIEWRWWVDKLDSLADSVSNIKKSQDLEEVLNWMIFYLQYIWQLNKHHDLTSIFFLEKKSVWIFNVKFSLEFGASLALIFLVITFSIDWCCSRIILCWRSIIGILRLHKCLLSKVDFFWRSIRFQ